MKENAPLESSANGDDRKPMHKGSDLKGHREQSEPSAHNAPCRVDVSGQKILRVSKNKSCLLGYCNRYLGLSILIVVIVSS